MPVEGSLQKKNTSCTMTICGPPLGRLGKSVEFFLSGSLLPQQGPEPPKGPPLACTDGLTRREFGQRHVFRHMRVASRTRTGRPC